MIYLDEDFILHPKVQRAGLQLGPHGAARVVLLYLAGLRYARKYLTDGFLPHDVVSGLIAGQLQDTDAIVVAETISNRKILDRPLWRKVRGGYRIHDFHVWNRKSSEVKDKREKERVRKQAWRSRVPHGVPRDVPAGHEEVSRADVRGHDPLPRSTVRTSDLRSQADHLSTGRTVPGSAVDGSPPVENVLKTGERLRMAKAPAENGNYRIVARVARDVLQRQGVLEIGDFIEAVKTACAQAHIAYGPPLAEHDVVHKACTSELFKFRHPDIAGRAAT